MTRNRARILALATAFVIAVISTWAGWTKLFGSRRPARLPSADAGDASPPAPRAYAGSASCRPCHAAEFDKWTSSHHALAETALTSDVDVSALDPERPLRVIGVAPLRQFIVSKGGREQVLETAYDPAHKEWFSVYGKEERQPGEWGHWTGRGMNWNSMCAYCHNTDLRKGYDPTSDSYKTTMYEMGVGCEACHGPAQRHVEWRREHTDGGADPTLASLNRKQKLDTCGTCHSRRTELTGAFRPGDDFADHFGLEIPDLGDIFYADGQVHEEDFEFSSFVGSKMFRAGVACQDCHDPHDGKTVLTGNALCMRCHAGGNVKIPRIDPATHTFHAAESAGAACVGCHMPTTTYMQRHARRDHGFTIPDPRLTLEHRIPNACTRCHADKSPAWAAKLVEGWYGTKMDRASRTRAQAVARARAGDTAVIPALRGMLSGEDVPLWRATAARLGDRFMFDRDLRGAVIEGLKDGDPLVRTSAARTLESALGTDPEGIVPPLKKALDDPVRSVRLAAAWSLRSRIADGHRAFRELENYIALSVDQPTGQLQEGALDLARGRRDAAISRFEKAVAWDPASAPLRHELAIAYGSVGRPLDAVTQLEAACRISPDDAEYRFALGLAQSEAGKLSPAIDAFQQAVRLDPRYARAWYNLGLAKDQTGDHEAALRALERSEAVEPRDASVPYARATILLRLGRKEAARRAAERALAIDPSYREAQALIGSL